METITRPGTPLRHRMLEDMRMRKFAAQVRAAIGEAAFIDARVAAQGLSLVQAMAEVRARLAAQG